MTVQTDLSRRLHARPFTHLGRWLLAQAPYGAAPLPAGPQALPRRHAGRALRALALCALAGASGAAMAGTHTVTTPGAGTWQVPAGVTQINIVAIGGGGGAADGVHGGSGAKVNTLTGVAVTGGSTVSYFVGGGGAGASGGQHTGGGGGGATAVKWASSGGWTLIAAGGGGSGGYNTGNYGRGGDGCGYAFGGYGTNGAQGRTPNWPGAAGQGGKANGVGGSGTGDGVYGHSDGGDGATGDDAGRGGHGGWTQPDGDTFSHSGGDGGVGFITAAGISADIWGIGGRSIGGSANNILGGAGGGGGGGYWGGGGGGGSSGAALGGRGGGGGGAAGLSIWPGMSPGDTTKGSAPFCVPAGNGGSSTGARGGDGSLTITWQDPAAPDVAPQLSGTAPQGTVGQAYSFTPTLAPANVTQPVSFRLANFMGMTQFAPNVPPGISFNSSNGALTGTPTTAGSYRLRIVASNGGGHSNLDMTIVINAPTATSGSCGPVNGTTVSAAPSGAADLCASGTASAVSGSGPWNWSCAGSNGGGTASCSASLAATDGSCGSANGVVTMTPPAVNLCNTGTASSLSGNGPWTWSCAGNGGTTAACSAPLMGVKTYTAPSPTGGGDITASFTGGGNACGYHTSQYIAAVPDANPATPPGISFPMGLFGLVATNCNVGETLNFTITYPSAVPAGAKYYKWGPEGANATPHWYEYPATINGNTVTFSLTDGGAGDGDRRANGTVVDPGGVGVPDFIVTVDAGAGTANPPAPTGAPGATPTIALTPPAGQAVKQVSSTCGVPAGEPAVVTAGPLTSFTTQPLIADCTVTVSYAPAAATEGSGSNVTAVPTLNEWATMALGLLLAGLGWSGLARRRTSA